MPPTKEKTKSRKKKFIAEVHLTYHFAYDPESKEFLDSLKSFRENISARGDEQEMMCHVVHNIQQSGWREMVEGVGCVSFKGLYPSFCTLQLRSGINMTDTPPKPDIDIINNDYI